MITFPLPLLGFCAFSGTGKTTLLSRLIPILRSGGIRIGVVKHAHHSFDIDHPGKDSFRLRQAGAAQMLIASRGRLAWIEELPPRGEEDPTLGEILTRLDPAHLDLVLVEGFKRESFPKIELHRPSLGRPLIFPRDPDVIAIACDGPLNGPTATIPQLDLNHPPEIADFVQRWYLNRLRCGANPASQLRVMGQ